MQWSKPIFIEKSSFQHSKIPILSYSNIQDYTFFLHFPTGVLRICPLDHFFVKTHVCTNKNEYEKPDAHGCRRKISSIHFENVSEDASAAQNIFCVAGFWCGSLDTITNEKPPYDSTNEPTSITGRCIQRFSSPDSIFQ